jgi:DNA mismatch endonuclease, patch repair protein
MDRKLHKPLPRGDFAGVTKARSRIMRAVRSKGNKTTEKRLRFALVRQGIGGWIMHSQMAGTPDFFFPAARLVVFVDGCFWHGCQACGHIPAVNRPYWKAKIERNRERDLANTQQLVAEGFSVIRIWEHELSRDIMECVESIQAFLRKSAGKTSIDCPQ